MEKLSYFYGEKSTPNNWQPCHVLEIVNYLKQRGYNYELYKETTKSKYILVNKNAVLFYTKCADICNDLKDLYFLEQEKEYHEYIQRRAERDKKQNIVFCQAYLK